MAIPTSTITARLATVQTIVQALLDDLEQGIAAAIANFDDESEIFADVWTVDEQEAIDNAIGCLDRADVIRATYEQGRVYAAYADPTESARKRVDLDEAIAIAAEDASLLVLLPG